MNEENATKIAAHLTLQQNDLHLLLKASKYLLLAAKEKVPGGPTSWEDTKNRLIQKIDRFLDDPT
jgi:hypothetical protein